jgi:hypothetical protein
MGLGAGGSAACSQSLPLRRVTVTFKVTVTVAFRYGWISTPL